MRERKTKVEQPVRIERLMRTVEPTKIDWLVSAEAFTKAQQQTQTGASLLCPFCWQAICSSAFWDKRGNCKGIKGYQMIFSRKMGEEGKYAGHMQEKLERSQRKAF